MKCEQCKLKDKLIIDRQETAEYWMNAADTWEGLYSKQKRELKSMTLWQRIFNWRY